MAEVEGLELTPENANFATLREIAASHVIQKLLPRCRLVKKQQLRRAGSICQARLSIDSMARGVSFLALFSQDNLNDEFGAS
jgi:hypothetical protein